MTRKRSLNHGKVIHKPQSYITSNFAVILKINTKKFYTSLCPLQIWWSISNSTIITRNGKSFSYDYDSIKQTDCIEDIEVVASFT